MIYKRGKNWHMDVTVQGIRYREALGTTDKREAPNLEKKRVAEILAGKGASKSGKDFARKPFSEAVKVFQEARRPHIADRTAQKEAERLKPLKKFFGDRPLLRFRADSISKYQVERLKAVSPRTVNMEVSVLRLMLKRAKIWSVLAEDVKMLPERAGEIGRALSAEEKRALFDAAASRNDWLVVYCAAVLAVSTTCRGVELKNVQWRDVDLFARTVAIRRSKTNAGLRIIPLNGDALAAVAKLRERSLAHHAADPEHYVFPACEHEILDPLKPQKSWRSSWRKLVKETGRRLGRRAAQASIDLKLGLRVAITAYKKAAAPMRGFRFHDLRHQAITELAEAGAPDATLMALAGHMSRRMLEHYSHVRMAAKRTALDKIECGLMSGASDLDADTTGKPN